MTLKATPHVLFLNPWDQRIGPNRYLSDMLHCDPVLARNSVVVLPEEGAAADEYRTMGCNVEVWPFIQLIHIQPTPRNLLRLLVVHTVGLIRTLHRFRAIQPDVIITNSENVWVGGM